MAHRWTTTRPSRRGPQQERLPSSRAGRREQHSPTPRMPRRTRLPLPHAADTADTAVAPAAADTAVAPAVTADTAGQPAVDTAGQPAVEQPVPDPTGTTGTGAGDVT